MALSLEPLGHAGAAVALANGAQADSAEISLSRIIGTAFRPKMLRVIMLGAGFKPPSIDLSESQQPI